MSWLRLETGSETGTMILLSGYLLKSMLALTQLPPLSLQFNENEVPDSDSEEISQDPE
jgi:hypothetical protein